MPFLFEVAKEYYHVQIKHVGLENLSQLMRQLYNTNFCDHLQLKLGSQIQHLDPHDSTIVSIELLVTA